MVSNSLSIILNEHCKLADLAQTQVCLELKKKTAKISFLINNPYGALPEKRFLCEVARWGACSINVARSRVVLTQNRTDITQSLILYFIADSSSTYTL